ncbi:hypothetical protein Pst134EA_023159 [Puccinia striiformis f. sp. tritici]|uniref:hypothetical protein n=1 Tax=Puccinia striiformis f. sp. tritici TaxID=168172 RepID=UPI0020076DC4|nr:hypothetical protein Pst134EA_023159 [Puccinia striiformis f. sp. tritici]KAH9455707.1 hypothetical protein Pst134EA_023159 [Puccinia striiformis f. sp. tritici]
MKFFLPIFIFAIALAQAATVRDSPTTRARRRQDYIDGTYEANARVMPDVCPNSSACSIMDSSWPTKGFNCPQKPDSYGVPDYSFVTAQDTAMVYGGGDAITAKEWPKSCPLPRKGSKMMKYSNGAWSAIYSITPTCNCVQGVQPKCTRANGLSRDTCNIAVLKFCEMRSGTDLCPPK